MSSTHCAVYKLPTLDTQKNLWLVWEWCETTIMLMHKRNREMALECLDNCLGQLIIFNFQGCMVGSQLDRSAFSTFANKLSQKSLVHATSFIYVQLPARDTMSDGWHICRNCTNVPWHLPSNFSFIHVVTVSSHFQLLTVVTSILGIVNNFKLELTLWTTFQWNPSWHQGDTNR